MTYDIDEALLLADRVLLLSEGRLEVDVRVPLPRPRDDGDAGFIALRHRLRAAVGVGTLRPSEKPVFAGSDPGLPAEAV